MTLLSQRNLSVKCLFTAYLDRFEEQSSEATVAVVLDYLDGEE